MRSEDPWYDALASGWDEHDAPSPAAGAAVPGPRPPTRGEPPAPDGEASRSGVNGHAPGGSSRGPSPSAAGRRAVGDARAEVYLTVQRSEAFQRVRRRYRRFVLPASVAFLTCYLAYVVAATTAPGLMSRPVAGVFNVAMAAGAAQFAGTFLVTWAYVRHARLRRDDLALELRWETQEMARTRAAAPDAGRPSFPAAASSPAVPAAAAAVSARPAREVS